VEIDWVKAIAIGGCVLWGVQQMREIYRRLARPVGLTVMNGEYKALVENLEQLKRTTNEMLTGHKLAADILGSMAAKQEVMAEVLEGLPCRASGSQLIQPTLAGATCGMSPSTTAGDD
jgi:hypothetical protein